MPPLHLIAPLSLTLLLGACGSLRPALHGARQSVDRGGSLPQRSHEQETGDDLWDALARMGGGVGIKIQGGEWRPYVRLGGMFSSDERWLLEKNDL